MRMVHVDLGACCHWRSDKKGLTLSLRQTFLSELDDRNSK